MASGYILVKAASLALLLAASAQGQIYISVGNGGSVSEYSFSGQFMGYLPNSAGALGLAVSGNDMYVGFGDHIAKYTTSGQLVNPSVVSGLSFLAGFTVSGNNIFVANINAPDGGEISTVGEYTTSGATVNASLISGLHNPIDVATDGTYLYVSSWTGGTVGKYTMTGQPVNPQLIGGFYPSLPYPGGIVLDGKGDLFVSTGFDSVAEFTTDGTLVSPSVVTGVPNSGIGLALLGDNVLDADNYGGAGGNMIVEYTTGGQLVKSPFISIVDPLAMVVVPEPSSSALVLAGLGGLVLIRISKRSVASAP